MPTTTKSDADGIQSAFDTRMGQLYDVLSLNLITKPHGPDEQQYVATFTAGYNAEKHARDLALRIVGTSVPMVAARAIAKKKNAPKRKPR